MAVDLEDRPDEDVARVGHVGDLTPDTPQGIYDDKFNAIAGQLNNEGVGRRSDDSAEPSELEKAESSPSTNGSLGAGSTDKESAQLSQKTGDNPIPFSAAGASLGAIGSGKLLGLMGRRGGVKTRLALAITGLIFSAISVYASVGGPALGLIHLKEVITTKIGGISSNVITTRSGNIYSRRFFFNQDGSFDGFKETGLTGWLKNRNSTKLLADMRSKGFDISVDSNGKFSSIKKIGSSEVAKNADEFESFWAKRGAIRESVNDAYPEKSFLWRSRRAKQLARRFGLDRSNWLYDNRMTSWVKNKELELRAKFNIGQRVKAAVRGKIRGLVDKPLANIDTGQRANPVDDNDSAAASSNAKQEIIKSEKEAVDDVNDKLNKNPLADVEQTAERSLEKDVGEALGDTAKSPGELAAASITPAVYAAEKTCAANNLLREVRLASATVRYASLLKYAGAVLPLLDVVKSGEMKTQDVAGLAAVFLYAKDKNTGETTFGSSAIRNLLGNKKIKLTDEEKRKAAPTTALLGWLSRVEDKLKGIRKPCKIVGSPLFGPLLKVVEGAFRTGEVATTVATDGVAAPLTVTEYTLAISRAVAASVLYNTVKTHLMPTIATAVAGVTCNAGETGALAGACLVSSVTAMHSTSAASMGMHPLTNKQVAYYEDRAKEDRRAQYASMSVWDRYFSTTNAFSLTSMAVMKTPVGVSGFALSGSSLLSSIGSLINGSSIFSSFTSGVSSTKVMAAGDPDEVALDDFGYPIMGVSPEAMNNEDYDIEKTSHFLIKDPAIADPFNQNMYLDEDGKPNLKGDGLGLIDFGVLDNPKEKAKLSRAEIKKLEDKRKTIIDTAKKIENYRLQCIDVDDAYSNGRSSYGNVLVNSSGDEDKAGCSSKLDSEFDENTKPYLRYYQMFRFDNNIGTAINDSINENYVYDKGQADLVGDSTTSGTEDGEPVNGNVPDVGTPSGNIIKTNCSSIQVDSSLVTNVNKLLADAKAAGLDLCTNSGGWRSNESQKKLREKNCGSSSYAINDMPASQCKPPTARPGTSNHEKGLAVDFQCNGGSVNRGGPCDTWLKSNASKYGLKNLPSEPWHYSTNGK